MWHVGHFILRGPGPLCLERICVNTREKRELVQPTFSSWVDALDNAHHRDRSVLKGKFDAVWNASVATILLRDKIFKGLDAVK